MFWSMPSSSTFAREVHEGLGTARGACIERLAMAVHVGVRRLALHPAPSARRLPGIVRSFARFRLSIRCISLGILANECKPGVPICSDSLRIATSDLKCV